MKILSLLAVLTILMVLPGCPPSPTGHDVVLTWAAPTGQKSVTGYNVYRASTAAGPFTKVSTTNALVPLGYIDIAVTASDKYCYAITTIATGFAESPKSAVVCTTIP